MTSEPVSDAIAAATEFARPDKTGGTCRRRNDQPSGRKGESGQPPVGTLSTEASKICPIEASNCA